MVPKRRDDLIVAGAGSELLILDRHNGLIHKLNETAGFIWDQCDGKKTVEDIVSMLVEEYGLDRDRARQDVEAAVENFCKFGLLAESTAFTSNSRGEK